MFLSEKHRSSTQLLQISVISLRSMSGKLASDTSPIPCYILLGFRSKSLICHQIHSKSSLQASTGTIIDSTSFNACKRYLCNYSDMFQNQEPNKTNFEAMERTKQTNSKSFCYWNRLEPPYLPSNAERDLPEVSPLVPSAAVPRPRIRSDFAWSAANNTVPPRREKPPKNTGPLMEATRENGFGKERKDKKRFFFERWKNIKNGYHMLFE